MTPGPGDYKLKDVLKNTKYGTIGKTERLQ
jgi:hypothetical protein